MLEEELKNKVAARYFARFDCTGILKRIDFSVRPKPTKAAPEPPALLWAEAKQAPTDAFRMLAQLLVTIRQDAPGVEPPKFLGCFDCDHIHFLPYHAVLPVFNANDFDWTQTPSAVSEKSVETVRRLVSASAIVSYSLFGADDAEIADFVGRNFAAGGEAEALSTLVDKNNFIFVYQKWRTAVMLRIDMRWDTLRDQYALYDRDFFLAELNVDDYGTSDTSDDQVARPGFYITFDARRPKPYRIVRHDPQGLFDVALEAGFKAGGMEAYAGFWRRYKRPPAPEWWDFITGRLDLLVPQDVRERKGAFFTPQVWVEKSQEALARALGPDWQDEYVVWDCAAGTGNLLVGLSNKYNVYASTLDQQDVDVMKERARSGANLLEGHVFQFDFLNDPLDSPKIPASLREIIADPERRRKLVVYINPPYAEATNAKTVTGTGENKAGVANKTRAFEMYKGLIGKAAQELFAQFFVKILTELKNCVLGGFSTLKILQATNFQQFRAVFRARLESLFLVPANTFDNVKGQFPIGFFVWDTSREEVFVGREAVVYELKDGEVEQKGKKFIPAMGGGQRSLTEWLRKYGRAKSVVPPFCALLDTRGNDFQNQKYVDIKSQDFKITAHSTGVYVSCDNLLPICVYFAVRHVERASWLNDRDQFLYPDDAWEGDLEFQSDCLAFALFHSQNHVSCRQGVNHMIPFAEVEVDARERFKSHFLSDYIAGRLKPQAVGTGGLFASAPAEAGPMVFSDEAAAVMAAGRALWRYYHKWQTATPDASLYDIKEHFQGRDEKTGRMRASSDDQEYVRLMGALREAMAALAGHIRPKVYAYGFLR